VIFYKALVFFFYYYFLFIFFSFCVPDVPAPPPNRLTIAEVYDASGKPQCDVLKPHFIREGRVEEDLAIKIIKECEFYDTCTWTCMYSMCYQALGLWVQSLGKLN